MADKMDKLIAEYGVALDGDTITTPGKFEGENASILYWYDAMMNGDGDVIDCPDCEQDDDSVSCLDCTLRNEGDQFEIFPADRDELDIPEDAKYAVLWHSEQGFEHLEYIHESIA